MPKMNEIDFEVSKLIKKSEVAAVVLALRSGSAPRIGQLVDYEILSARPSEKPSRPYRVAVEQWHLDEAQRMLDI
jgi:hypothetical protein